MTSYSHMKSLARFLFRVYFDRFKRTKSFEAFSENIQSLICDFGAEIKFKIIFEKFFTRRSRERGTAKNLAFEGLH